MKAQPQTPEVSRALVELRALLGDAQVSDDAGSLAGASTATFATRARPSAIAQVVSREQVIGCVEIARRHGIALYPTSRGRNWGMGSRVPTADGAVLLDLSRLSRIVAFDEEMAWVTVEPGVTFAQLHDFLQARGSQLFASTTGGSPHSSVLANALERGDGTGPYGDRWGHVAGLEVVLGTGELVHTGFARFAEGPLAPLGRWGVGPTLDGLFSQSNLGIVTEMTLWLCPLPGSLSSVRFELRDPARLAALVDGLRALRLSGVLRSVAGIWNDYRVLSTERQYPWDRTDGKTPLDRATLAELTKGYGGSTWFGLTAIYAASTEIGRALGAELRRVLEPLVDVLRIDERSGEPRAGAELFAPDDPGLAFLQGVPHQASLGSVYWRKRRPPPADPDPDRDRCGVVWACPTLPFRGADVLEAVRLVEALLPAHGFEPLIAMTAQTERSVYLVPLIVYDREVEGEDERAMACHDQLLLRTSERGWLPYRLGVQSMASVPAPRDDSGALLGRLKRALDPDDVLAPGRYDFRETWQKRQP